MRGGKLDKTSSRSLEPPHSRPSNSPIVSEDSSDEKYCVLADLLIPGSGEPIENGCIIVEGNKITYAGDAEEARWEHVALPKTHVKVLMPGMWDCHVHLFGLQKLDVAEIVQGAQNQALVGARCAKDASLLLNAGFTSVRDLAGYGIQIGKAIDEGTIIGPTIYSANNIIVSFLEFRCEVSSGVDVLIESDGRACRCPQHVQALVRRCVLPRHAVIYSRWSAGMLEGRSYAASRGRKSHQVCRIRRCRN